MASRVGRYEDNRDNEFIAELVRLLESHGNDEFKRKHAEIPSLLQQLDVLTQRRKRQEENLKIYKDRVNKLQGLAQCHKEMLDLSKKLVKWLGNGFSSAEILENIRDAHQKADLIDRIRANAIRGGRERQVRDALEKLEVLRRKVIDGLTELGEGEASMSDELETSIQSLMKREKSEVEKTKTSCNRLQQEVQKIDDELSNAEKELQRAISCAYQSAIKQSTAEQSFLNADAVSSSSTTDLTRPVTLSDEERRRYESALRDHVRAIQELDIVDDCSDVEDSNYSDDDRTTSLSEEQSIAALERPQMCMKPRIVTSERDNGKLRLEVDLQSSLSETRPESVSFIVECSLESYRKSSVVKMNRWNTAIPLPNEDASLRIRVRAQNAAGLGDFSEATMLPVEGVRSRKRRLASQKAEADKVAREEEKVRVLELQERTSELKQALSEDDLDEINRIGGVVQSHVQDLTSLHSEKRIRASSDAAAVLRVARAMVKESIRAEDTRRKQADFLAKVRELARATHFADPSIDAFSDPHRTADEAERRMADAEVTATAVCLEWQELINEASEKGAPTDSVEQVREHFFKEIAREAERCETPPRALGDVLDLAVHKTNVFGSQLSDLLSLQAVFKKKREIWVKRREKLIESRRVCSKPKSTGKKNRKSAERRPELVRPATASQAPTKPRADDRSTPGPKKKRDGGGTTRSERRQRNAAKKVDLMDPNRSESPRTTGKNGVASPSVLSPSSHPHPLGSSEKQKRKVNSLTIGERFVGRVVGIAHFGFFVDIGCEKPGLVHISQIRDGFISDVSAEVNMHDEVNVRVAAVSVEKQTFLCSMRDTVDCSTASQIFDVSHYDRVQERDQQAPPGRVSLDNWPDLKSSTSSNGRRSRDGAVMAGALDHDGSLVNGIGSLAVGSRPATSTSPSEPETQPSSGDRTFSPEGNYSAFPSLLGFPSGGTPTVNGYSPFGTGSQSPRDSFFGTPVRGPPEENRGLAHEPYAHMASQPMRQEQPFQPEGFGPFGGGRYNMFGGLPVNSQPANRATGIPPSATATEGATHEEIDEFHHKDIVNSLML